MQGPKNTPFRYNFRFVFIVWRIVILDYHILLCYNNEDLFIMQNFIYSKTIIVL